MCKSVTEQKNYYYRCPNKREVQRSPTAIRDLLDARRETMTWTPCAPGPPQLFAAVKQQPEAGLTVRTRFDTMQEGYSAFNSCLCMLNIFNARVHLQGIAPLLLSGLLQSLYLLGGRQPLRQQLPIAPQHKNLHLVYGMEPTSLYQSKTQYFGRTMEASRKSLYPRNV